MCYLIVLFIAFILAIKYKPSQWDKDYKLLYIILCGINILLFGLRYNVGGDTITSYMVDYEIFPVLKDLNTSIFFFNSAGPLFVIIMAGFKSITTDFVFWQFFHSLILNICIFYFIRKYSLNPFLSFIFFFYIVGLYFNTETLKESLAIAIFLINYKNLINKHWYRYYLISLLSIGCHYGASVLLILPFFMRLKYSWGFYLYSVIILIAIHLMADYIFSNMRYLSLVDRVASYGEATKDLNLNYTIMSVTKYVLVPYIALVLNKYQIIEKNRVLEPMVCLYILMGICATSYPGSFERLGNYFALFFFVYLANTITVISKYKNKLLITTLVWILVITPYAYEYAGSIMERWVPYYSVFDKSSYIPRNI